MSHIATWKVPVKSLTVLAAAAKRLGGTLIQGQQRYRWFGSYMGDYPLPAGVTKESLGKCEHAIHFGAHDYEVGVRKNADDTYTLLWDFWCSGHMPELIGKQGEKLAQAYAVEDAKAAARAEGYLVSEETRKDGTVEVVVEVQS